MFVPKSNVKIQLEEKKGEENKEEVKDQPEPEEEEVLAKLLEQMSIPET